MSERLSRLKAIGRAWPQVLTIIVFMVAISLRSTVVWCPLDSSAICAFARGLCVVPVCEMTLLKCHIKSIPCCLGSRLIRRWTNVGVHADGSAANNLAPPICCRYARRSVIRFEASAMEHWQVTYLGIRQILASARVRPRHVLHLLSAGTCTDRARRGELARLAVALHIGFIRMSGRTLDAYKQVPALWSHPFGAQLAVDPPDLGTLRTLYETRARTLIDHQVLAYQALGFRPMAEHQRRYVVRWLKERLTGRPERGDLLYELKRWLYEHHILIVHDRLLKRLIVKAGQDVEGSLTDGVIGAFGDATLDHWSRLLAQPDNDHGSLQQ